MKTSKRMTKRKQTIQRNRNENTFAVTFNLDLDRGEHTATVHHAGSHTNLGAGPPRRGAHDRLRSRASHASGRAASTGPGGGHARSGVEQTSASSHRLSFQVALGDGYEVHENGQMAKAVTPTGEVVWTGRVSGPSSYETETSSLSEKRTGELVRCIHSYHVAKAIDAGGPGSATRQRTGARSSGGAHRADPAKKTAARKTAAKRTAAKKTAAAAKRTAAKKTTAKKSKARSFVEVKADGKVLNTYGPFDKARAKTVAAEKRAELEALAAKPGAMSVEVVSVSGEDRARLAKRAEEGKKLAKKNAPASSKKNAPASSKKAATPKPASSKKAAKPARPKAGATGKAASKPPAKAEPTVVEAAPASATRPSRRAAAQEAAPRTMRVPVSVGSDEVVFGRFRQDIREHKPNASEAEVDQELTMLKHVWRAGAREKVIAWMHAHQIADVVKGMEDWGEHNTEEAETLMAAPSRVA